MGLCRHVWQRGTCTDIHVHVTRLNYIREFIIKIDQLNKWLLRVSVFAVVVSKKKPDLLPDLFLLMKRNKLLYPLNWHTESLFKDIQLAQFHYILVLPGLEQFPTTPIQVPLSHVRCQEFWLLSQLITTVSPSLLYDACAGAAMSGHPEAKCKTGQWDTISWSESNGQD